MSTDTQVEIAPASTHMNAIASAAAFIVTVLVAFIVTPRVVRGLGDAQYGIVTVAGELTGYYGLLDLGIRGAVGFYVARLTASRQFADLREVIRTAFWNLLALAGILLIAAGATAWNFAAFFNVGDVNPVAARVAAGILFTVFAFSLPASLPNAILLGLRRLDIAYGCQIVGSLAAGTAMLIAIETGGGLIAVVIGQASGTILVWALQLLAVRFLGWRFSLLPPVLRSAKSPDLYRIGGANTAINIAQLITLQMDLVIIGKFLGTAAVTHFHIGRYLAVHGSNFVASLAMTLPPVFTQYQAKEDYDAMRRLYLESSRMLICLLVLIGAGILIFGRSFLLLWMGASYLSGPWWNRSDSVLYLMTCALLIRSTGLVSIQYLLGTRQLRALTTVRVSEAILTLTTSIFLVQVLGIAGVALSKLIVGTIGNVLFAVPYSIRLLRLPLAEFLRRTLTPAALVGTSTAMSGIVLQILAVPTNWPTFFGEAALTGLVGGTVLFFSAVSPEKRDLYARKLRIRRA